MHFQINTNKIIYVKGYGNEKQLNYWNHKLSNIFGSCIYTYMWDTTRCRSIIRSTSISKLRFSPIKINNNTNSTKKHTHLNQIKLLPILNQSHQLRKKNSKIGITWVNLALMRRSRKGENAYHRDEIDRRKVRRREEEESASKRETAFSNLSTSRASIFALIWYDLSLRDEFENFWICRSKCWRIDKKKRREMKKSWRERREEESRKNEGIEV